MIKRKNIFFFIELNGSIFKRMWEPFTQGGYVPCLVKIDTGALEKKTFKFWQWIFAIWSLLIRKGVALHLNKLYSLQTRKAVRNWLVILEEEIVRFRWYIIAILLSSLLGKGWGPLFKQTWFPFTKECFVPNLGWNCPSGSVEEDF